MATSPIWQDKTCSITSGNLYKISGGVDEFGNSGEFFRGRAVSPTGLGNASVYYNRICAPRMQYGHPSFLTQGKQNICLPQTFIVYQSSDNGVTWSTVVTTSFRPDWSYQNYTNAVKSIQMTRKFHPKMTLFLTVVEWTISTTHGWYDTGGGHQNTSFTSMTGSKTAVYPCSIITATGIKAVGLGTLTWDEPRNCAPGALYFRNAYGGWSNLLIDGSLVESNDVARWTRKMDYDNSGTFPVGERNYVEETTKRWTVNTGAMTDAESANMWHLLTSTDVWLHDFTKDTVLPVILEGGAQEEKKYKIGRRIVTYTFTCRLAQERIRQ